jgi:hypothetical protein
MLDASSSRGFAHRTRLGGSSGFVGLCSIQLSYGCRARVHNPACRRPQALGGGATVVTPGASEEARKKAVDMVDRHRAEMVAAGLRPDQVNALSVIFTQAAQAMGGARNWARMVAGEVGEQLMTKQLAELAQAAGSVVCDCAECVAAQGKRS